MGEEGREDAKGWLFTFEFTAPLTPVFHIFFLLRYLRISSVPSFPYHPPYSGASSPEVWSGPQLLDLPLSAISWDSAHCPVGLEGGEM